ncbi:COG3650 family protein [[Phormidium ambiguum] IAM M-71]|uniref:COG3650 family protein n=1 Tax=[Phormidium ambiguum] IAM M-71 TaxID=454136 RepID=UPI0011611EE5|nr:hypothetical protein [Phormidium ambiguum]
MRSVYFYAVLLGLCVNCLGRDSVLAGSSANGIDVNKNPSEENGLIAQRPPQEESFTAVGTEPFWNLTINRNAIVYSAPDFSSTETNIRTYTYPYVAPKPAEGRPIDVVRVYRLNGQPNGTLIIKKVDSCSDGMSDNVYPYAVTLILGDRVLEGCAKRQSAKFIE